MVLKCSWPCGFALFTAKQDHHIHMYQVFMLKISFFLLNCSNFSVVDFSHFWVTVQILHGCNDFTVINVDKNPTYWWRNMFMFLSTQPNLKDDTTWSRKVEHRMILKKKNPDWWQHALLASQKANSMYTLHQLRKNLQSILLAEKDVVKMFSKNNLKVSYSNWIKLMLY